MDRGEEEEEQEGPNENMQSQEEDNYSSYTLNVNITHSTFFNVRKKKARTTSGL